MVILAAIELQSGVQGAVLPGAVQPGSPIAAGDVGVNFASAFGESFQESAGAPGEKTATRPDAGTGKWETGAGLEEAVSDEAVVVPSAGGSLTEVVSNSIVFKKGLGGEKIGPSVIGAADPIAAFADKVSKIRLAGDATAETIGATAQVATIGQPGYLAAIRGERLEAERGNGVGLIQGSTHAEELVEAAKPVAAAHAEARTEESGPDGAQPVAARDGTAQAKVSTISSGTQAGKLSATVANTKTASVSHEHETRTHTPQVAGLRGLTEQLRLDSLLTNASNGDFAGKVQVGMTGVATDAAAASPKATKGLRGPAETTLQNRVVEQNAIGLTPTNANASDSENAVPLSVASASGVGTAAARTTNLDREAGATGLARRPEANTSKAEVAGTSTPAELDTAASVAATNTSVGSLGAIPATGTPLAGPPALSSPSAPQSARAATNAAPASSQSGNASVSIVSNLAPGHPRSDARNEPQAVSAASSRASSRVRWEKGTTAVGQIAKDNSAVAGPDVSTPSTNEVAAGFLERIPIQQRQAFGMGAGASQQGVSPEAPQHSESARKGASQADARSPLSASAAGTAESDAGSGSFATSSVDPGNGTPTPATAGVHVASASTAATNAVSGIAAVGVHPASATTPELTSGVSAARALSSTLTGGGLSDGVAGGSRLDGMGSPLTAVQQPHRTLVATPTTLEVGIPDGTQGWLRIRAQVGEQGQVSASLAAGSSAGQEMLHRELPALNAYLHGEQLSVTAAVAERSLPMAGGQGGAAEHSGRSLSDTGSANGGMGHSGTANEGLAGGQEASDLSGRRSPERVDAGDAPRGYTGAIDSGDISHSGRQQAALDGESGRWLNVQA